MDRLFLCTSLLLVLSAAPAVAAIPQTMSYQGMLTDGSGTPVADGAYDFTFGIYDVASGLDAALWTETHTGVAVAGGHFQVVLGDSPNGAVPLNLAFDVPYWLGITVDGGAEMTPRVQLAASGYSLKALTVADNAIGSAQIQPNSIVATDIATNAITAAEIATNAVGAAEIASGAVGASEVADNSLTRLDLQDEPGVASNRSGASTSLDGTDQVLVSRTITIPAAGYIVATGTLLGNIHPDGVSNAWVRASVSITTSHDFSNYRYFEVDYANDTSISYTSPISVQDVYYFSTSGAKTINLIADASPLGTPHASYPNLVLMYFPSSYGTVSSVVAGPGDFIEQEGRAQVVPR